MFKGYAGKAIRFSSSFPNTTDKLKLIGQPRAPSIFTLDSKARLVPLKSAFDKYLEAAG